MNANLPTTELAPEMLENHPIGEIAIGSSASLDRTVTKRDIQLFAAITGDVNPAHVDALYASSSQFREIIAHGMLGGALISTVLGTRFPGPGTIYLGQTLKFLKPVHIGDTLTVTVTVTKLEADRGHVTLVTTCINQHGDVVIDGLLVAHRCRARLGDDHGLRSTAERLGGVRAEVLDDRRRLLADHLWVLPDELADR